MTCAINILCFELNYLFNALCSVNRQHCFIVVINRDQKFAPIKTINICIVHDIFTKINHGVDKTKERQKKTDISAMHKLQM